MSLIRVAQGGDFIVDYDKNRGMYRVSVNDSDYYINEFWFDAYEEKEVLGTNCFQCLKKDDDIYYIDRDNNEIEHGKLFSITFKEREVACFSVNFDNGDFDEFVGEGLGRSFFINKEDAEVALKKF